MHNVKASEFFITGIDELCLSTRERDFINLNPLGGVILFKRNIESLSQVIALNCSLIQTNNAHPPIISVDQEGGRVARLRGICTDIPPLKTLAPMFLRDPHLAYRMGAMQGRELVALGFNLNFAPVCDIINNSDNEVIGDRAFSDVAHDVALLAAEYIKGLQGAGVAACAKHFPGHGATAIDSHLALPVVDTDENTMFTRELLPFSHAIAANVATIMTAHIIATAFDKWPATLSEKVLQGLLRTHLGFNQVVISDDLTMKAVADHYTLREILEHAMLASVDLFIVADFSLTKEAIAILDDLIANNERIRTYAFLAKQRIDALRNIYVGKPASPDLSTAKSLVRCAPHLELVESYR